MIDLYGGGSPNVLKVAIMLEEVGLAYTGHNVRVMHNANFNADFLALNPLGKVPVIVDHDHGGQPIFESGAILIYLAETYGSPLLPASGPARWEVMKWLMVQMSLAGPMLGQVNHFQLLPSEADSYAAQRYRDQAALVYRYFEDRLNAAPWLGGDSYSIADIAMYPWAAYLTRHGFAAADHPKLTAWREHLDDRPAVKRATAALKAMVAADPLSKQPATAEQLDRFFGRTESGPPADFVSFGKLGPITTARI